jgi:hypothetical protein
VKFWWTEIAVLDFEPAKFRSASGVVRKSWNVSMRGGLCSKSRSTADKEKETTHCADTSCLVKSEV